MSGNNCNKIVKAPDVAFSKGVQHILAVLKPDGTLALSGSEKILNAVFHCEELYTKLHLTITANRQEEGGIIQPIQITTYPRLSVSTYSPL